MLSCSKVGDNGDFVFFSGTATDRVHCLSQILVRFCSNILLELLQTLGYVILRELGYLITDFKIAWQKHTLNIKHKCY